MISIKFFIFQFFLVIFAVSSFCQQVLYEERIDLNLSKYDRNNYLDNFTAPVFKSLQYYNFDGTNNLTVSLKYQVVPPEGSTSDDGNIMFASLKNAIMGVSPRIKIDGTQDLWYEKDNLTKAVFDLKLSVKKGISVNGTKMVTLKFSSFGDPIVDQLTETIQSIFRKYLSSGENPFKITLIIIPPKDATVDFSQRIEAMLNVVLVNVVNPPNVATVDMKIDSDLNKLNRIILNITFSTINTTALPTGQSLTSDNPANVTTERSVKTSENKIKTIFLDADTNLTVREMIIERVNHDVPKRTWNLKIPVILDFNFQKIRTKVTPKEMSKISEHLQIDLKDLEPNATIYKPTFDFDHYNSAIINIRLIIPSVDERFGIHALKKRFPDVIDNMVEMTVLGKLGTIPSKVEQILGYKLLTSNRVDNGELIYLYLPFKIRSNRKGAKSLQPLLYEHIKKFIGVNIRSYQLKVLNPNLSLLVVRVRMPYSLRRAQLGIAAKAEEFSKKEKGFFTKIVGTVGDLVGLT